MEVKNHPALMELLGNYSADDFPGKIGEIAAYCNIAMDGMYIDSELDNLCVILYHKLQQMRKIILH